MRQQGDYKATTRQQGCKGSKAAKAVGYGAAGGRGKEGIDKRITN
jgi:hypothetical protein